jgi:serine phosphatase RsbU (regulator of sigma subunit)
LLSIYIPYLLNFLPLLSSILALSIVFVLFPTGIYIWRKGFRPARFYTLAFTALFAGILIYTFRNLGIIPNNLFTTSAVKLGSVLEALLLSLGLADRVNIAEKEKQEAQTETISALQEKESLISNQNKLLEEKVTQRTQEISSKNELLENQNEEIITKNHEIGKQRDSLAQKSEELTETLDELKTKNQEVISSINYAQRIQNAMLPQPEEIKTILPHSFVLFKPKDIVSGDFYWLIKKENKIIVAVVDCTGHGVPGAFMSMIGNDLLNEIVGFRDTQSGILEYAGAKSPLVYIQQGHLSFIRGDKLPIGGSQGPSTREYTKRILQIQEGDVLYLFSDGFADQFGGPNQKKFMIKHFRELLHSIHEKPIHQQKEILNKVLEDWKGKEKQVDDILVLGIKFTQ